MTRGWGFEGFSELHVYIYIHAKIYTPKKRLLTLSQRYNFFYNFAPGHQREGLPFFGLKNGKAVLGTKKHLGVELLIKRNIVLKFLKKMPLEGIISECGGSKCRLGGAWVVRQSGT